MAAGPAVAGKKGAVQTVAVLNLLTDLAFNLLIFFVVLASNEVESRGRHQQVPSANKEQKNEPAAQNVQVKIGRTTVTANDESTPAANLVAKLGQLLAGKTKTEERIVVVTLEDDLPYSTYIKISGLIEKAGGVITLVVEDDKVQTVR